MNSIDIKRRLAILEAQLFDAIDNIENTPDHELQKIVELIRLHRDRLARGDHDEDSPVREPGHQGIEAKASGRLVHPPRRIVVPGDGGCLSDLAPLPRTWREPE